MNLAPLDIWRLNDQNRSLFTETINSVAFRTAITFALADYQRECSNMPNGAYMLQGANGIVERILNMGEPKQERKVRTFNLPVEETTQPR